MKRRFYTHDAFKRADRALKSAYKGVSAYRISRAFLEAQGASHVHAYGETPLTTMATIAQECELGPGDTVIEMGAGRGRAALFLSEYIGCKVIAYEQIPLFVEKMIPSSNLLMVAEKMDKAPFSRASSVFLYGTMLADDEIAALAEAFPQGIKIITVSYPLSAYHSHYQTIKQFPGRFPWGTTEVYLNERTCKEELPSLQGGHPAPEGGGAEAPLRHA